jgi:hypothetical protein
MVPACRLLTNEWFNSMAFILSRQFSADSLDTMNSDSVGFAAARQADAPLLQRNVLFAS